MVVVLVVVTEMDNIPLGKLDASETVSVTRGRFAGGCCEYVGKSNKDDTDPSCRWTICSVRFSTHARMHARIW